MTPHPVDNRLAALWRFAIAITILNILGHTVLGFEQSWAQPAVALATAYAMELLLESINAWAQQRPRRFEGGIWALISFLLPAHITGLAVSMLLYTNSRLAPIAFASAVAIGSKVLVRVPRGRGWKHSLNPSNTGIAITLLLFPWVGIAPPYQFTESLSGLGDWLLPMIMILSGTFLNTRFTGRAALIIGWLAGFGLQAVLRSLVFETPITAALLPMSGMAFLLFTFYMVTDPGTTPRSPLGQFIFGLSVAIVYAILMITHVVFGLFFALLTVSAIRTLGLLAIAGHQATIHRWNRQPEPMANPVPLSVSLEAAHR